MEWSPTPGRSYYNHTLSISNGPSPLTTPNLGAIQARAIASRISELIEIYQASSASGGVSPRRRENSRTGFGRRLGNVFAGPALRNSRLDEQPETDGAHSFLGEKTSRTNHRQEHATSRRSTKWEKTTGLHAQMQPTGIANRADEAAVPWVVASETDGYRTTRRRKYDRNGNLIDYTNEVVPDPRSPTSYCPVEPEQASKFPSLSTVAESQFTEQEEGSPGEEDHKAAMQDGPAQRERGQDTGASSSMPIETPLSTKRRTVREMYDYYGIKRPTELSSDCGTQQIPQAIRVQRNCHVCGWINGPDTKCWKCMHRFCRKCDDISPKVFFQVEDSFSPESDTPVSPIKLPLVNVGDEWQNIDGKDSTRGEDSFTLKYPQISVPELDTAPSLQDTKPKEAPVIQSSIKNEEPNSESTRQHELRRTKKSVAQSLKYERGRPEMIEIQAPETGTREGVVAAPLRIPASKSSTYQPLPVYVKDIPKRSSAAGKATKAAPTPPKLPQAGAAKPLEKTNVEPSSSQKVSAAPRYIRVSETEQTNFCSNSQVPNTSEPPKPDSKTGKLPEYQSPRLRPMAASVKRGGSHRHRRTRVHTSGSQSNSSSSNEPFCCDSSACRATHNGHQPYRHSITCSRRRYRFKKETDSGYIASRSHNDEVPMESASDSLQTKQVQRSVYPAESSKDWRWQCVKVPQDPIVEKKSDECIQCQGDYNTCQCSACQSICRIMEEQEQRPLLTANPSSGETEVFMPQPQRRGPSPEKLDLLSSVESQRMRDKPDFSDTFEEPRLTPVESVEKSLLNSKEMKTSSTVRRVIHEEVKADRLGKPISSGYEPLPKIPLHTISYIPEDSSTQPLPPATSKPEVERPSTSRFETFDRPTPAIEKSEEESLFTTMYQQPADTSAPEDETRAWQNLTSSKDKYQSDSSSHVMETAPKPLRQNGRKSRRSIRRDFEILDKTKVPASNQAVDLRSRPRTPDTIKNSLQQTNEMFERERKKTSVGSRKASIKMQVKSPEVIAPDLDTTDKSPQANSSLPSPRRSPPKPVSKPISACPSVNLEREVLNQKLEQQQYELDRITKLLNDNFTETQQRHSHIPKDTPVIEDSIPKKEAKEKVVEKKEERKLLPWRLNFFDRKSGESSIEVVEEHDGDDCIDDEEDCCEEEVNVVEEEVRRESKEGVNPRKSEQQDTTIPRISIQASIIPISKEKEEEIRRRESEQIKKPRKSEPQDAAATPEISTQANPKSTSTEKEEITKSENSIVKNLRKVFNNPRTIPSAGPSKINQKQEKAVEKEENVMKEEVMKSECLCNCGILGVTVIIHFEGREDLLLRANVESGV